MKFLLPAYIVAFLIAMSVFLSGCSGSTMPEPAGVPPQSSLAAIQSATPPAATTVPDAATTVTTGETENAIRIFGKYRWAEYRNNITQTLPPNPRYQWEMQERVEHSVTAYNGAPAIHERITQTADYPEWIGDTLVTTKDGYVTVADLYFTDATGEFLGGSMTASVKGVAQPVSVLRPDPAFRCEEKPSYFMGVTPFGAMNIPCTDQGIESVTVPAGTYPDARKYTGLFRDGTQITFWVARGVPVPVRYQFPNRYLDGIDPIQSYELRGWG